MEAGLKLESRGPGGQRGPAGGCSVGSVPRGRREHVVRQLDRVKGEEPYGELYPRVCKGLSDSSKVIVFSFKGVSPVTATFSPPAQAASSTPAVPRGPVPLPSTSQGTPASAKCSGSAGAQQSIWAKER
ncbi:uncharacterized protein FN964_013387 isoform 1-T1 [Alca torda]